MVSLLSEHNRFPEQTLIEVYYNQLAPYYKFIYADWEKSLRSQAAALNSVIREYFGDQISTVLDAACGIGTQCIGLAELGYKVTGSDLSSGAIKLAKEEAQTRDLPIDFSVVDMRQVWEYHQRQFDIVLACDNSIPHLLNEEEILQVFKGFFLTTKEGGGCLISVRDYDLFEREDQESRFVPRQIHPTSWGQIIIFDIWNFEGDYYEIRTYIVEDQKNNEPKMTVVKGGKYFCVTIPVLEDLFKQAGFQQVTTLKEHFFQPLIVAEK